jgi:hypothetical protein
LCRQANGECDVVESCDGAGSCPDNDFEPAGTACGDPSIAECSGPDQCSGTGVCLPNDDAPGTACDDGYACTVDDGCDAGTCEAFPGCLSGRYGNIGGFDAAPDEWGATFNAATPHWTAVTTNPSGCAGVSASTSPGRILLSASNSSCSWSLWSADNAAADLFPERGEFTFSGEYTARQTAVTSWGLTDGTNTVILLSKTGEGDDSHAFSNWRIQVHPTDPLARMSTDGVFDDEPWVDLTSLQGHYYFYATGVAIDYQDDAYFDLRVFSVSGCATECD